MLLNIFHTECLNPFVMREKSENQQSPKLNWILGYDQVDFHQISPKEDWVGTGFHSTGKVVQVKGESVN